MTDLGWRLWRYDLPLVRPLTVMGAAARRRQGLVLELDDGAGGRGLGEASPLPGFHGQTLDQVAEQITRWCRVGAAESLPPADSILGDGEVNPSIEQLGPVARFGVESALWDLHLAAVEGGAPRGVPCTALIGDGTQTAIDRAVELAAAGITAFKLKVGRGTVGEDVAAVRALAEALPDHVQLRADANRSWSLEQAERFGEAGQMLQFVEEPLRDPTELDALWEASRLPVALDESLADHPDARHCAAVKALVLKPSVLGGVRATLEWARRARRRGQFSIVSATFESAVGMRALVRLAGAVGGGEAHGLGTWSWFARDLLDPPLRPDPGFTLPLAGRPALRRHELTLVAGS